MYSKQEKINIIEQAAAWALLVQQRDLSSAEQQQFEQWLQQSTFHAQAWQNIEQLQQKFQQLPTEIAAPVIKKQRTYKVEVKHLLMLLATLPSLLILYYLNSIQQWSADYRTTTGERKTVQLEDGGRILLNANTAIDIDYSRNSRSIILRKGEIWIETQHDVLQRPFWVKTPQGAAQALGTKYLVKIEQQQAYVAVQQGAVAIQSLSGQQQYLSAGQQVYFNVDQIKKVEQLHPQQLSWTQGFLLVKDMPLQQFVERIKPYQKGYIYLDPALQQLRISGNYPIDDLAKLYKMLQHTYGVEISHYMHGHWVYIQKQAH
ncbi:FecR family protein [Acinetobacter larvae]|uniref:Histidine kinase n=1 Tax=Acinetobacter larvae TaxID=1789224 RepID=A0A1B2LZE3_9GAMM|nr:FecR domain-containing protein [Acinetobacter larvae]AOA58143.1 hypothetical protein BFG52_07100 [Acinetobacter larvae]